MRNCSEHVLQLAIAFGLMAFFTTKTTAGSEQIDAADKRIMVARVKADFQPELLQFGDIVRGKKRNWSDGSLITMVLPSRQNRSFKLMEEGFFSGRGFSLQRHWLQLVFSGRGNPPLYAQTDEEMCELLLETRGASALFYRSVPEACQSLPQITVMVKD
ncbi:MAG: hypothetical protein CME16_05690 [Gemmatimonadetes bacterium]|nr:hypothetical protein [Gemmatimonadota bacterium]